MNAERACPSCGTPMSSDTLEGLCPKCVGRAAFNESVLVGVDGEGETGADEAASTPAEADQVRLDRARALEEQFARLKPEEVGEQIGQYKLLQQLGEGGFGTVWMAEQEKPMRRRVALKIIKLGMDTKEVIARFEQERQALAMMDHPNIAKVFDAGVTQWGRPFFVMELVRGIKITEYCDQANLPTSERLVLFVATCNAIQHAHQKGIIHRDIKPSNVLVTLHDGVPVPKVIDFGVAKATQSQRLTDLTLFTQFEQMIGTPLYMSPEQAEMSGLDIDTRSDIYSLGVLLYELLTGRTPFDPEELMRKGHEEMRRVIREQEPKKPSTFVGTMAVNVRTTVAQHRQLDPARLSNMLRGDLDWIVMKALEKDRTRRYETANGLAKDIERHLADEPVLARPASRLYRARRVIRRNKVAFAAAGVVALAIIAGCAVSTWAFLNEKEARKRAVASENAAETAATRSQQVATLLRDMLEGVGPQKALGQDTKLLKEILDNTATRVSTGLREQPTVEAELREILGGVYFDLGEHEQAELMFAAASRLQASVGAEARKEVTARLLNRRGLNLVELGLLPQAQEICTEALALNLAVHGEVHAGVATSLHHLGEVLRQRRHLVPAETYFRQSLNQWKQLGADQEPPAALALNDLGLAVMDRGDMAEAERLCAAALAIRTKHFGTDHPFVAESLTNLALALWYQGRLKEAEEKHTQALAIREKILGGRDPNRANSYNNLALVLRDRGELVEAETMQRRALTAVREMLGESHKYTIQTRDNLATVLRRRSAQSGELAGLLEALATNPADTLTADAIACASALPSLTPVSAAPGSATPWRYTFAKPEANWFAASYKDDGWSTDPAPRGSTLVYPRTPKTPITSHTGVWLRHEFSLPAIPVGTLVMLVRGRQDAEVYLNGVAVAMPIDWSDTDVLVPCSEEASATLRVGQNTLAVHCQDTDAGRPLDVQLYTTSDSTLGRKRLLEEFGRMIEKEPTRAELYAGRADVYGRLREWSQTASSLETAKTLQPTNAVYWYKLAAVLAYTGDIPKYLKHRSAALEQFRTEDLPAVAEQVCRLALLAPIEGAELAAVARLAEVCAAAEYPLGLAGRQFAKGLGEYRSGRFPSAWEWSERALKTGSDKSLPGWSHERERSRGSAALFLSAMAFHEQKKSREASDAFVQAMDLIKTRFAAANVGEVGREWSDWLVALTLQREAGTVLK
jgi:serine/threonine protein kinase